MPLSDDDCVVTVSLEVAGYSWAIRLEGSHPFSTLIWATAPTISSG